MEAKKISKHFAHVLQDKHYVRSLKLYKNAAKFFSCKRHSYCKVIPQEYVLSLFLILLETRWAYTKILIKIAFYFIFNIFYLVSYIYSFYLQLTGYFKCNALKMFSEVTVYKRGAKFNVITYGNVTTNCGVILHLS